MWFILGRKEVEEEGNAIGGECSGSKELVGDFASSRKFLNKNLLSYSE